MIPVISTNYLFSLILICKEIDTFSTRFSLNLWSKGLTQTFMSFLNILERLTGVLVAKKINALCMSYEIPHSGKEVIKI